MTEVLMSRIRFALARAIGSVVFLASACTINGKAVGPHFGGATSASAPAAEAGATGSDPRNAEREVPDITGMSVDDAKRAVAAAGFSGGVDEFDNDTTGATARSCTPGTICKQTPSAGERYGGRHPIRIVVGVAPQELRPRDAAATRPSPVAETCASQQVPKSTADGSRHYVTLPDLAGLASGDAEAKLRAAGFTDVQVVRADCHPKRPLGTVCALDPKPGCYLNTKPINLEVSATE
jgi:hypothetical protein